MAALVAPAIASAHSGDGFHAPFTSTPPQLDGVFQPGEWAAANTYDVPGGGQLLLMHDGSDLYVALRRLDSGGSVSLQIYLDDDHDGLATDGDDAWVASLNTPTGTLSTNDAFRSIAASGHPDDTSAGGTNDTTAGAAFTAGEVVIELRHPLCSADLAHDVCLVPGAPAVGVEFLYFEGVGTIIGFPEPWGGSWDDQALWADLTLGDAVEELAECPSGMATIDFDDAPANALAGERYAALGVHFVDDDATTPRIIDSDGFGRVTSTPPNSLFNSADTVIPGSAGVPLTIDFDSGQNAVGFFMGNGQDSPPTATVTAFDAGGLELGSVSTTVAGNDVTQFYGIKTVSGAYTIRRITIDYGATTLAEEIDDLCFVTVGEPAVDTTVTNTEDSGDGSLRQAIINANENPGADVIAFAIPSDDQVHTISLSSPLPWITDTVTIDGESQPIGKIELDGADADGPGLVVAADDSAIRGVVINRFPDEGIRVEADGVELSRNYIGTDADGAVALGNGYGIRVVDAAETDIRHNVVSGNRFDGIRFESPGRDGQLVLDNLIGVGASGEELGNGGHGVYVEGDITIVGDDGSVFDAGGNEIAYNDGAGVWVQTGGGNRIVGNSIHDNEGLGIHLEPETNQDQPAPTLELTGGGGGFVDLEATVAAPDDDKQYRFDFYASAACDPSGAGEGQRHIGYGLTTSVGGEATVETDGLGPVSPGEVITATATGQGSFTAPANTSEFSACAFVSAPSLVVTNTNDEGAGSLRQAILNANALEGHDTITFAIPGEGVRRIDLTSPLPAITDPVTIDGRTQPGWIGPPLVRVDGSSQDGGAGLELIAGDNEIRGLMLTNLPNIAINVLSSGNTIAGNYVGTDGFVPLKSPIGVFVSGSDNKIGGAAALDRNVVSGLDWAISIRYGCFEGCELFPGTFDNVVRGNYVGTDATGNATLGAASGYGGIEVDRATGTTIAGNVIGGSGYDGAISVVTGAGTQIQGNLIGVAANGAGRLGNEGPGVRISSDGVLVGGTALGEGNTIAYNGAASIDTGVVVDSGSGNSILGNSIHDNIGLGIALASETNDGQPAPVLSELLVGTGIVVRGNLDAPDGSYRLEFFHSPSCDASGSGEGKTFLGAAERGAGALSVSLPSAPADGVITATATSADGSTSEFSNCVEEDLGGEATGAITLTSDERTVPVGAKVVPLSAVPASQLPSFAGSPASAPVGSIPVGSIPVGSIPVGSIPVGSIPVGSIPVGSIPVGSIPVGSIPVGSIGLSAIPVGSIGLNQILLSMLPVDADALLEGTELFNRPRQTITLADVYANPVTRARFDALSLAQSGLAQSLLSGVPFSAFLLGGATLSQLPPPDAATWCAAIAAAGGSCTGVSGTNTVMGLSIAGIPVGSIPVGSIPVGSIPVGSIPVGSIPVGSIDLEASRLAGIPVGSISDAKKPLVLDCGVSCPAGWTLLDAKLAGAILPGAKLKHLVGAFPPDLTLNDLILGIVPRSALAWESLPIDGFQLFDASGIANTVRYRLRFTVPCPVPADLSARVRLPHGWLYKTGTTRWQYGTTATPIAGAEPTTSARAGARWTALPPSPCTPGAVSREVELSFQAISGFRLGGEEATAVVTMNGASEQASGQAPVLVSQNWESNDTPGDAPVIAKDQLIIGHVSSAGDKEIFRLPVPPVRAPRTTVHLSHIADGADFDLVIGKPAAPPLQSSPVGSIPVGSIPVEDGGSSIDNSGTPLPPETLQDIPVGSIPVGSISATRGSVDEVAQVVADGETGFYTIMVTGYNGSHSDLPFVLRVVQTPPPELPPCPARNLTLGAPGTLPASLGSDTHTLFVVNKQRLQALYPGADVDAMLAAASTVAGRDEVKGAILPVDGDAAVRSAYAAWDADPCAIGKANDVVAAINAVIATYRAQAPELKYVVLLGTDETLPMSRRLDTVTISNETDEAADLLFTTATAAGTRANALYAAAALGYFLSDSVYGAFTSIPWLGRDLYLPNVAVGRLVESPLDIERQLELYVSANGVLSPATTLTTGYDFLTDGVEAVAAALAGIGSAHTTLIDDTWNAAQLKGVFTDKSPPDDVLSVNAHYSHWLLEPASGAPLVKTSDLPPIAPDVEPLFARRILFTMGCHAGLNVADTLLPGASTIAAFRDWVQSYAQQRAAVYVANTGFGYGDTEANALSERLMSIFAAQLARGGVIGERWVDTVQEYFATAGLYGVYDEKALSVATFYGLPFWRLPGDPASPPAGPVPIPYPNASFSVATEMVTPSLTRRDTDRGSFWEGPNRQTLGIHYRPIQPRLSFDVTSLGHVATGVLIKELRTQDVLGIDPVNATPTIDLAANEPEKNFQPLIFPAAPVALTRSTSRFGGDRQHAVVIAGQFRPGAGTTGTERLVKKIELEIAYVENQTDFTPPLIEQVAAVHTSSATIFVKASDAQSGVARVAALWSDGSTDADGLIWHYVELDPVAGGWAKTVDPLSEPIQVIAMAQNAQGLVAYSANKGENFPSVTDTDGPAITLDSPAPGAEYLLDQVVPLSFACSDAGVVVSCEADPAASPIDTSTVGPKTITIRAIDLAGNEESREIHYRVIYGFSGFFQPISNPPFLNQLKAAQAVPLRFSLSGNQGLSVFEAGYPASRQIACDTSSPVDADVPTTSAGASGLTYSAGSDTYTYTWKTEKTWASTCRRLVFVFNDGKTRHLDFRFTK